MSCFWLCLVADSPRTFRGAGADSVEARSKISGLDTLAWSKRSIATASGRPVQPWLMEVDDRTLKVKVMSEVTSDIAMVFRLVFFQPTLSSV
jgi:hypothetical protein